MGEFAKSLSNVQAFAQRRHPQRINRRLDDRDAVVFEAMKLLEEHSETHYAACHVIPATLAAPSLAAGAVTGIALTGVNFVGDAVKAAVTTGTAGVAGAIDWEAVLPGEQSISVTITDTGGALTVTANIVAGTILVVHNGDTAAAIVAAVNADAVAKYMVNAAVDTAGVAVDAPATLLTGGVGDLMSLSIASYPMDGTAAGNGITNVTDTVITLDFDPTDMDGAATSLVATQTVKVALRADGSEVDMPWCRVAA